MSWNCKDLQSRRLDYLDGGLPPLERKRLEEHFERCAACRAAMAEHRASWALLDHYTEPEPSAFFVTSTMRELRSSVERSRVMRVRRVLTAAAATILLALAFLLYTEPVPVDTLVEAELLENIDLLEDLDFLESYGEELELAMEFDLYDMLNEGERLQ